MAPLIKAPTMVGPEPPSPEPPSPEPPSPEPPSPEPRVRAGRPSTAIDWEDRAVYVSGVSVAPSVHEQAALRLAGLEQRYTPLPRALVATLAEAGRPLSIPEILASNAELPQSSAYRNVTDLIEAGVVRRVTGVDDHGRFELAEELAGHHHHLACGGCGRSRTWHPHHASNGRWPRPPGGGGRARL